MKLLLLFLHLLSYFRFIVWYLCFKYFNHRNFIQNIENSSKLKLKYIQCRRRVETADRSFLISLLQNILHWNWKYATATTATPVATTDIVAVANFTPYAIPY